jgi:hypothetical protein
VVTFSRTVELLKLGDQEGVQDGQDGTQTGAAGSSAAASVHG